MSSNNIYPLGADWSKLAERYHSISFKLSRRGQCLFTLYPIVILSIRLIHSHAAHILWIISNKKTILSICKASCKWRAVAPKLTICRQIIWFDYVCTCWLQNYFYNCRNCVSKLTVIRRVNRRSEMGNLRPWGRKSPYNSLSATFWRNQISQNTLFYFY